MRIEDIENGEQFWAMLITTSVDKGYSGAVIPTANLEEGLAINVAIRLNMSLLVKDGNYVFSSCKDGSSVQLGTKLTLH